MSDPLDLSKLREALAKATPGPWRCSTPPDGGYPYIQSQHVRHPNANGRWADVGRCAANNYDNENNASLIVLAINSLPSLLDAAGWAQLHEKAYHARGDLIHKQEAEIATLRADVGRLRGAISGATITTTKKKKS